MTLYDLARMANTSVGTVSKAFSGGYNVNKETRDHIFALARANGCFDKYYKGPREKRMIAILYPESESEYYGRLVGTLEKSLSQRNADVILALTRFDHSREAHLFSELAYRSKIDGIILIGDGRDIKNPDEFPLVILGEKSNLKTNHADYVVSELSRAIEDAVTTLKDHGHRRIAFIGECLTVEKKNAFCDAMRRHGLPLYEKYLINDSFRFAEAGERGMQKLIDQCHRTELPSAVVTAYDQIAFGAMYCAQRNGFRIPEDISFIGMDDISVTNYLGVPLSSIGVQIDEVCERVVDLVFRRIENKHYREWEEIVIPARLQLRASVSRKD